MEYFQLIFLSFFGHPLKSEPWSTKTEEGNGKSSLRSQSNNKTRTVNNNIECENARTGLRMKQRKEFQTGSGL